MLRLEGQIAEPKHHRRVYDELSAKWIKVIDACKDLPRHPDADTVKTLYLSAWGGKRYLLLVAPHDLAAAAWVAEIERQCWQYCCPPADAVPAGPFWGALSIYRAVIAQ